MKSKHKLRHVLPLDWQGWLHRWTMPRTTLSLTDSEIELLEKLKSHFDATTLSDTIKRSISQSSLLKRYSDEQGDLVIEKDGKKYVIPSRG